MGFNPRYNSEDRQVAERRLKNSSRNDNPSRLSDLCRATASDNLRPHNRTNSVNDTDQLKAEVKKLLIDNLMLQQRADEITDDVALFGPGGLGLDSVDALQLVVALEKNYGLKIADPAAAKETMANVNSIVAAITKLRA